MITTKITKELYDALDPAVQRDLTIIRTVDPSAADPIYVCDIEDKNWKPFRAAVKSARRPKGK